MPILTRKGHSVLQEIIVWATVVTSATSMYFIVTANRGDKNKDKEAGRFGLQEALRYTPETPITFEPGALEAAVAPAGDSTQLR
jgi:hypothetical protein